MSTRYHKPDQKTQDEQREARRAAAKQTVEEGMDALVEQISQGKSEALLRWFDTCSHFHKYSPNNQLIIQIEGLCRGFEPSFVATKKQWDEIGMKLHGRIYLIAEGHHAIWLWRPNPYKKMVVDKQTGEEEEKTYANYALFPAFAAEQMNQEPGQPPLPSLWTPQPDSEQAAELLVQFRTVAQAEGFTCAEERLSLKTNGYCDGKKIVIADRLDSTLALVTFLHEYAHAKLHWQDDRPTLTRQQKEADAEAISFIVAKAFGVESPFAADYLQMYRVDKDLLRQRLTYIQKSAHEMILAVQAVRGGEVEEEEEQGAEEGVAA